MKIYETPVAEVTTFATKSFIMLDIGDIFDGDEGENFGSLI